MFFVLKLKRKLLNGELATIISSLIKKIHLNLFFRDIVYFNKLVALHEYQEAYTYSQNKSLLKHNKNPELVRKIALSAYYSGNKEEATKIFEDRLFLFHKINKKQLLLTSEEFLPKDIVFVTKYVYLGGYANSGFLLHKSEGLSLASKIIKKTKLENKEVFFYTKIFLKYAFFSSFTPIFFSIHNNKKKNFIILTAEHILGERPNNSKIQTILKINRYIESIDYKEALSLLNPIGLDKGKAKARNLHKKSTNVEIFSEIKNRLEKSNNFKLEALVSILKSIILENHLYKLINPDIHYSFCHNDFHKNNIISQTENICKVFDWNSYSVALRGWDMCYYFGNFEFKFSEIEEIFINKINHCSNKDLVIAKIFYIYIQIYIWVLRLRNKSSFEKMNDYFVPAIKSIEVLHLELNKAVAR
tara:strand:+ start:345 stop:1592 length:1248 start_codon:yes stop_codon:yes gene_type:complete